MNNKFVKTFKENKDFRKHVLVAGITSVVTVGCAIGMIVIANKHNLALSPSFDSLAEAVDTTPVVDIIEETSK